MERLRAVVLMLPVLVWCAACGSTQGGRPTAVPTSAPTTTPEVSFAVALTAVPTTTPLRPRKAATKFVPPAGAYIALSSSAGPPEERVIRLHGGHLPRTSDVRLEWAQSGHVSPVYTDAWTDRSGNLRSTFNIPASPPGRYSILASVNGLVVAQAQYVMRSNAVLAGQVTPSPHGNRVRVSGSKFLPRIRLLLVAYPFLRKGKPVLLGTVRADASGSFAYARTVAKLPLGQYVLRAWSEDAMATQMAETIIQVVV